MLTLCTIAVVLLALLLYLLILSMRGLIRRYPRQADAIQRHLRDRELPVIAGWSVCPFAQTDLVVYVASTLRIPLWKCLAGVGAGEAAIVSFYIFTVRAVLLV